MAKRLLAPLAGGAVKAKEMMKGLEEAARQCGMDTPVIPPTVATTEMIQDSGAEHQAASFTHEHTPEQAEDDTQQSGKKGS